MRVFVTHALALATLTAAQFSFHRTFGEESAPSAAPWRAMAIDAIDAVENDARRSQLRYESTYVLVRAGALDEAREAAAGVSAGQQRVYAHTQVAKGYRDAGKTDLALDVLDACRKSVLDAGVEQRADWIGYMVCAYAEAGFVEEACTLAAEMKQEWQRENVLQDVARIVAQSGDLDRARALLEALSAKQRRQAGLALLVAALASSQKADEAIAAGEGLETSERADYGFINLTEELLRVHRHEEAAQAAARIDAKGIRLTMQGKIAAATMTNDDAAAIEARIAEAATREMKLPLFELLIKSLAADGRTEAAEGAIESMVAEIEASPRKPGISAFGEVNDQWAVASAKALHLEIAKMLAKSGNQGTARQQFAKAEEVILGIADEAGMYKSQLVISLATAQIEAGELAAARQLIEQLPEAFDKTMAAVQLAQALVRAGDFDGATVVAKHIVHEPGRGHALGRIAGELIRAGELDAAKSVLTGLGETTEDVQGYREAGAAMIDAGREGELEAWLPAMPSTAARAYACLGASERRVGAAQH